MNLIISRSPLKNSTNNSHHRLFGKNAYVYRSVKNSGAYFDTSLTMERQVNDISKACYYDVQSFGSVLSYEQVISLFYTLSYPNML